MNRKYNYKMVAAKQLPRIPAATLGKKENPC